MFSIQRELHALVGKLAAEKVSYALCGALALAVYGYPRATLDLDLLVFADSSERLQKCAHERGFTLKAAQISFAGGQGQIERLSKALPGEEDLLMLDLLTLTPKLEDEMAVETVDWRGETLPILSQESLIRLKLLRGSTQDLVDVEKLR